jgi:hypothetical protein
MHEMTRGESVKACGSATFEPALFTANEEDACTHIQLSLNKIQFTLWKREPPRNKKKQRMLNNLSRGSPTASYWPESLRGERVAVMTPRLYASSDAIHSRRYCKREQKRHVQLQPPGQ